MNGGPKTQDIEKMYSKRIVEAYRTIYASRFNCAMDLLDLGYSLPVAIKRSDDVYLAAMEFAYDMGEGTKLDELYRRSNEEE